MLRFFRKAKLLPVIMLLLVVGTMSSKDLMHSFVQHHAVSCLEHADDNATSLILPHEKIEKSRFCAFCHLDNFTFTNSDQLHTQENTFSYYTPALIHYKQPVFSNSNTVQLLRGPPVTA